MLLSPPKNELHSWREKWGSRLSQNVKKRTICAIFASRVKVIRITFLNEDEGNGFFLFWKKAVSRKELTSLSKSTTALTQLEPVGFLMLRGRLCGEFGQPMSSSPRAPRITSHMRRGSQIKSTCTNILSKRACTAYENWRDRKREEKCQSWKITKELTASLFHVRDRASR